MSKQGEIITTTTSSQLSPAQQQQQNEKVVRESEMNYMMSEKISKTRFRISFIGDYNVGKTSIINRIVNDVFNELYRPTVGVYFAKKNVIFNDYFVTLQFWDTAGQERFQSILGSYIRQSNIIVVVYDITSKESFDNVKTWIAQTRSESSSIGGKEIPIILVGNKSDLSKQRQVQIYNAQYLSKIERLHAFYETSAKLSYNIDNLLQSIIKILPLLDKSLCGPMETTSVAGSSSLNNDNDLKTISLKDEITTITTTTRTVNAGCWC